MAEILEWCVKRSAIISAVTNLIVKVKIRREQSPAEAPRHRSGSSALCEVMRAHTHSEGSSEAQSEEPLHGVPSREELFSRTQRFSPMAMPSESCCRCCACSIKPFRGPRLSRTTRHSCQCCALKFRQRYANSSESKSYKNVWGKVQKGFWR